MSVHLPALTGAQIELFIADGFIRLDQAFSSELAAQGRAILWRDTGCDPDDRSTWTKPVIRLGGYSDRPFREAANTPFLHSAYDQLVGPGNWVAPGGLGTFPIRFPSEEPPGDDGWHIDGSFMLPSDDSSNFFNIRANVQSRGSALLMLFLFSDVGEDDAPTRIRCGSHLEVARYLEPFGTEGRTLGEVVRDRPDWFDTGCEALATGEAGTVYLCHPFLVHAAQPNRGNRVKFMAQPPLMPTRSLTFDLPPEESFPVERAIRLALMR